MKALKRIIFSFVIAYLGKYFLRLLLFTCKIEIEGQERFKETLFSNRSILMLWHNRLPIVSEILFKIDKKSIFTAFVSKSRDGDPLAVLAESYKTGRAIRVAHNKRHQALKELIDTLKNRDEVVVMTPDGPRGPRYEVKPGIVTAALEAKAAIIPLTWISDKFWQLRSWDRMIFPKPFSKIFITFGEPIFLKEEISSENGQILKESLLLIEEEVNKRVFKKVDDYPN